MPEPQAHIVRTHAIEIGIDRKELATPAQEAVGDLFRTRLWARTEQLMSEVCGPGRTVRIERLAIDVGRLPAEGFEDEFEARYLAALERELRRQVPSPAPVRDPLGRPPRPETNAVETLAYFLLHGALPWWVPETPTFEPDLEMARSLVNEAGEMARMIRRVGRRAYVRRRIILLVTDPVLERLVRVLEPGDAEFIIDYARDLQVRQEAERFVDADTSEFREAKWELILRHLLEDRGSAFNQKSFLRGTLEGLAARFRLGYAELLAHLASAAGERRTGWRDATLPNLLLELHAEERLASGVDDREGAVDWASAAVEAWLDVLSGGAQQPGPDRLVRLAFWRRNDAAGVRAAWRRILDELSPEALALRLTAWFPPAEWAAILGSFSADPAIVRAEARESLALVYRTFGDRDPETTRVWMALLSGAADRAWRGTPSSAEAVEREAREIARGSVRAAVPGSESLSLALIADLLTTGGREEPAWTAFEPGEREDLVVRLAVRHPDAVRALLRAELAGRSTGAERAGALSEDGWTGVLRAVAGTRAGYEVHVRRFEQAVLMARRDLPALIRSLGGGELASTLAGRFEGMSPEALHKAAALAAVRAALEPPHDGDFVETFVGFLVRTLGELLGVVHEDAAALVSALEAFASGSSGPDRRGATAEGATSGEPSVRLELRFGAAETEIDEAALVRGITAESLAASPVARVRLWTWILHHPDSGAAVGALLPILYRRFDDRDAGRFGDALGAASPGKEAVARIVASGGETVLAKSLFGGSRTVTEAFEGWLSFLVNLGGDGRLFPFGAAELRVRFWMRMVERIRRGGRPSVEDVAETVFAVLDDLGVTRRLAQSEAGGAEEAASPGATAQWIEAGRVAFHRATGLRAPEVARLFTEGGRRAKGRLLLVLFLLGRVEGAPRNDGDLAASLVAAGRPLVGSLDAEDRDEVAERSDGRTEEAVRTEGDEARGRVARPDKAKRPAETAKRAPVEPEEDPVPEPFFVSNAGLVILAPFLGRLFQECGYLDGGELAGYEAAQRAVHLLQHVVSGGVRSREYSLTLNKVLCGLEPHEPVIPQVELAERETTAADTLLRTVIAGWPRVASTSMAGFRASFLWRNGRLTKSDERWDLKVERRGYDVLFEDLPWGFSLVKHPWMPLPLHVDWI